MAQHYGFSALPFFLSLSAGLHGDGVIMERKPNDTIAFCFWKETNGVPVHRLSSGVMDMAHPRWLGSLMGWGRGHRYGRSDMQREGSDIVDGLGLYDLTLLIRSSANVQAVYGRVLRIYEEWNEIKCLIHGWVMGVGSSCRADPGRLMRLHPALSIFANGPLFRPQVCRHHGPWLQDG